MLVNAHLVFVAAAPEIPVDISARARSGEQDSGCAVKKWRRARGVTAMEAAAVDKFDSNVWRANALQEALAAKHGSERYDTALGYFSEYCKHRGYSIPRRANLDPMEHGDGDTPATGRLFDFMGWLRLYRPKLQGSTVEGYISTIRTSMAIRHGWRFLYSPLHEATKLRMRQRSEAKGFKQPAGKALVQMVADDTTIPLGVRCAVLVAYDGLLRVGEYTARTTTDPRRCKLQCDDVHVYDDRICFKLRFTKGDAYNAGEFVNFVPVPGDRYCPVAAVREYVRSEPLCRRKGMPFFVKRSTTGRATFVTKRDISNALKKHAGGIGFSSSDVASHSLRIGGAYEMANAGESWEAISVRGRWSLKSGHAMAVMYARVSRERLTSQARSRAIENCVHHRMFVAPVNNGNSVVSRSFRL